MNDRIHALDGLRGLASLVVVFYHACLTFNPLYFEVQRLAQSENPGVADALKFIVAGTLLNGDLAVWVFWIISGFSLSLKFFKHSQNSEVERANSYLKEAVVKRYPRLFFPVLASVLLAYAIQKMGWMYNRNPSMIEISEVSNWLTKWYAFEGDIFNALKFSAWDVFFDYDSHGTYNNVLWTIEKEFYGSLFTFAFLSLAGNRRLRVILYPLLFGVNHGLGCNWINAFMVGVLISDFYANMSAATLRLKAGLSKTVGFAGTLGVLLLLLAMFHTRINLEPVYLATGAGVVSAALYSTRISSLLNLPVFQFLGKISFGMYLVHIPLTFSAAIFISNAARNFLPCCVELWFEYIVTIMISIVTGYLFYWFIDRPTTTLVNYAKMSRLCVGGALKLR